MVFMQIYANMALFMKISGFLKNIWGFMQIYANFMLK